MDINKIKQLQIAVKVGNGQPFNIHDTNTRKDTGGRYIANFNDNFVRSCMYLLLPYLNMEKATDEELAQYLIDNNIWTECELASHVYTRLQEFKIQGINTLEEL